MPKGAIEGLLTFLGILFFFVLPMIARARNAARRSGQLGGLPRPFPQAPGAPVLEAEEEPEEEPVSAAVATPTPAPATTAAPQSPVEGSAVTPAPQPPSAAPAREWVSRPAAALAAPGRLQRLRRLPPWQQAVALAEILGPPRSLQEGPPSP